MDRPVEPLKIGLKDDQRHDYRGQCMASEFSRKNGLVKESLISAHLFFERLWAPHQEDRRNGKNRLSPYKRNRLETSRKSAMIILSLAGPSSEGAADVERITR